MSPPHFKIDLAFAARSMFGNNSCAGYKLANYCVAILLYEQVRTDMVLTP